MSGHQLMLNYSKSYKNDSQFQRYGRYCMLLQMQTNDVVPLYRLLVTAHLNDPVFGCNAVPICN